MKSSIHSCRSLGGLPFSLLISAFFLLPSFFGLLPSAYAQGPLAPPGPPAPTMKTLEQVEPRTAITNIPFEIKARGSYYLTGDLVATVPTNGITISADDVTLDLNGFSLVGAAGSLAGIVVPVIQMNVEIRNGVVRDWGLHGVDAVLARNSVLHGLRAFSNGWASTFQAGLRIGRGSRVVSCEAGANQYDGIFAAIGCAITDCSVFDNGGPGISASEGAAVGRCSAYRNAGNGIAVNSGSSVSDCAVYTNGATGIYLGLGSTARGCASQKNGGEGFFITEGGVAQGCAARQNSGAGFYATLGCTLNDCAALANGGDGISADAGSIVRECASYGNGSNGVVVTSGCTVRDCTAYSNTDDGIEAGADCRIENNNCSWQISSAGIHTTGDRNRIEGNNVGSNNRGLDVDGVATMIIHNTAGDNSVNYDIAADNHFGDINDLTGGGGPPVSGNSESSSIGNFDPWANFAY